MYMENQESKLHEIRETLINNDYHIHGTHFKIGAKLHSEDFYYAKPLFQNSEYATYFAKMIVEKIKDEFKIPIGKNIILIGYEMYSEMLLGIVRKTLKENGYNPKNIKHFVGIDNEGKFSFKPSEKDSMFWLNNELLLEECHAVIIVPIASTGSTAVKIKDTILKKARKIVKPILEKINNENLEDRIKKQISKITFSYKSINIIAAQDNGFIDEIEKEQINLITVPAKWHFPSKCSYCFDFANSRPLFGTDKSYLTPSLIFNNPKGKTIPNDNSDKTAISDIDTITFDNSLKYKRVKRNNEFFLFSVNSPQFIKENGKEIQDWLKNLKNDFKTTKEDKIVILAPCHETNSEFLNLVNEYVFNSIATIIYHQANVDYIENYKPLNERLLNEATKVFYVDDNLISGSQFFDVYHLFRDTIMNLEVIEEEIKEVAENTLFGERKREVKTKRTKNSCQNKKNLTGAILLRDSSTQETHDRFLRAVKKCRSFVAYNLPPALSFDSKKPLEHERKRFADLRQFALHDVLIKTFDNKEQELDVESDKEEKQIEKETKDVEMFKKTHKIFEYFKNEKEEFSLEDLRNHCCQNKDNPVDDQIILLKVLTQYPFTLYKPLKEKAFDWHKCWLNEFVSEKKRVSSYDDFKELKFLIRRAVFLDNLQIIAPEFLSILSGAFSFVENQLPDTKKKSSEEKNYNDFPIFLIRIYLELIHKNGWVAVKLLENIPKAEKGFTTESAQRFFRMLKIELAAVVNDFYESIIKQYDREWRNLFNNKPEAHDNLVSKTIEIQNLINNKKLTSTNKYKISKTVIKCSDEQFYNFLWIKQLIFNDTRPKSYLPATINYQQKIDAILEKMKSFFPDENVQAFFIVTDAKDNPYVLYDINNVLFNFEDKTLIDFLKGKADSNNIANETTAEYKRGENTLWQDCYNSKNDDNIELKFLDKNVNWLYLIRISELKDDEFSTQGLLGFYNSNNLEKEYLHKQLLMLLRQDMSAFIKKHNKNDEFAELKQAELVKRLAYLAGHGRQTMQKLASENHEIFGEVISTMEKLQYLFALKLLDPKGNAKDIKRRTDAELFNSIFFRNYPTYKELGGKIKNFAREIYKSEIVENIVALDSSNIFKRPEDVKETDFVKINKDILYVICFELIINAKKNRWNEEDEKTIENKLEIKFEKNGDNGIIIKATNTGAEIYQEIKSRIQGGLPIKKDYEISGLDLIRAISKYYNGKLDVKDEEINGKYQNTIIVSLKQEEE